VVCEVPNHPQGVVHPDYRRVPGVRRRRDGFTAWHVWVATSPVKTRRTRLAFYGSYAGAATLLGAALRRPDVVLASSPPLPVAAVGAAVAARHRVPWVMDVRDLWPDAAVALGELSPGRALRAAERLAQWLYRDASAIVVVTEPFRQIVGRDTDPRRIALIPNGTTELWLGGAALDVDRATLDLPIDRWLWAYAGNVGPAQGLEAAIDAARLLGPEFHLLVLGDGASRAALEARAAERAAGCVSFRDQVPPPVALRHLRAADALLVPLSAHPVFATFVPSKLFDFCAVGRPVILSAAGEPARLAAEAGAALCVAPGDPEALAAAVRRLRGDQGLGQRLSAAGHRFASEHRRESGVERLEDLLRETVARG
jgi:glycosyltransferase involved in cell wall biosynthesis